MVIDVNAGGISRYMDFERINDLYAFMLVMDKSELDKEELAYVNGAMDAMMTILGSKTDISEMLKLDLEPEEYEKAMEQFAEEFNVANNPRTE